MAYKDLFFDLDHTLWDFELNSKETMQELYSTHHIAALGITDFDAFFNIYTAHNHRLWDRYSKGYIKQEELRWKRIYLSLLDFKIANEQLSKEMSLEFLQILPTKKKLFPHTIEILNYLKEKDYKMHLITNGFESVQMQKIKNANIAHYFTEVITSETSNSLKPNKEIFEFALKTTNATLSESIMIGDNETADIQGGINIGMDTVFVNHLNVAPTIPATYTITHLKELEALL
ncbi:MAG: YjjG family noncanonical pyrimidine nucleotidase [Sediminibacterium sp.]|jgi:putative hydrolase of the HAD superfamily|nr:YjjG family noncanonical pyrimidine nucleotidase [Sediminibacterium sp.]